VRFFGRDVCQVFSEFFHVPPNVTWRNTSVQQPLTEFRKWFLHVALRLRPSGLQPPECSRSRTNRLIDAPPLWSRSSKFGCGHSPFCAATSTLHRSPIRAAPDTPLLRRPRSQRHCGLESTEQSRTRTSPAPGAAGESAFRVLHS